MIIWSLMIVIMTMIGSLASLFLKKASSSIGIFQMMKNINLYIGAGLYLVASCLNILLLRYLDYSVVLPLTSLTYVWTLIISAWVLKEKISIKSICGVGMIFIGAIFIAVQ